jgi:hypothetical protein
MSQSIQDNLFEDLAGFNNAMFSTLVLAAIKRQLSDEEARLLHRASDLKLRIDDLSGL